MSNGFNPLSMFKPTGNPVVQSLLQNKQSPIDTLLDQQSFPTQFRKEKHQLLQKYMTYKKYAKLVEYITEIGDQKNKNRGFKYPFIAAQILSIDNQHTYKYFISDHPIVEQQVIIEQIQIEQQIDSNSSFISSRSQGSIVSDESQAQQKSGQENEESINLSDQSLPEAQMQKNASQIDEDDFPFMQDIKTTKRIKQKRQKIIIHEYEPLIKKLYENFSKTFDHTLTGYVCKVLNAILSKNPNIYGDILDYVQKTLFLNHIESRSTEQFLICILTFSTEKQQDIRLQYNIILLCMHKIFDDRDKMVVQNFSFIIGDVLSKLIAEQNSSLHFRKLIKELLRLTFFQKVTECFDNSVKLLKQFQYKKDIEDLQVTEVKIKQFAKIYSFFIDLYLKIKQKQNYKSLCETIHSQYEEISNQFTQAAFTRLQLESKHTNKLSNLIKKSGMTKIILINTIFKQVKQNFGFSQQILAEKNNFFSILFILVKQSPLNSILHNSVFEFWIFFIQTLEESENQSVNVIGSLFKQALDPQYTPSLLTFASETFQENRNKSITKKVGYTGHLIKILISIQNLSSKRQNQSIIKIKKSVQWSSIVKQELQPYLQRTKVNLGSFTKRRNVQATIYFQKDKILDHFKQFLKGTKFTTLDQFQNLDQDESDSEDLKLSRRKSYNKQTQKQIYEMQIQQFYLNAGIQNPTNINSERTKQQNELNKPNYMNTLNQVSRAQKQ